MKGKLWFKTQGIDIVDYMYCRSNNSRSHASLDSSDLKSCEICGQFLYKIDEESRYVNDDSTQVQIVQKRHMVFIDSKGHGHYTCYGVNRCFSRVGFDLDNVDDVPVLEYTPPSLEKFLESDINMDHLQENFIDGARAPYESYVKPFLESWIHEPINKNNVLDFINDLLAVERKFLALYCDVKSFKKLKQKILNIIGVRK